MSNPIPPEILTAFIMTGKGTPPGAFQPPNDVISNAAIALQTGLGGKHLAAGTFQLLAFTGVDASEDPTQATLAAAAAGATVAGVVNLSDLADAGADFETVITTAGKILQTAAADYSTKKFAVLLVN